MAKPLHVSPICWITDPFQPSTCDTQCQHCGRLIPNGYDGDNLRKVTALLNRDEEEERDEEQEEERYDDAGRQSNGVYEYKDSSSVTNKKIKKKFFCNPCQCCCGAMYCNRLCHEKATQGFHSIMCVGPHDENHATYKYKVLALESGPHMYSTLMLTAHYYWRIIISRHGDDDHHVQSPQQPPWRQRHQQNEELYQIEMIFDTNQPQTVQQSFELFIDILKEARDGDKDHLTDENKSVPSLEEWKALAIYVHCNKFYGTTQSLLAQECHIRTKENAWDGDWISFVMNLESTQNGIATKIELMDQPEDFFQPISWVALFDSPQSSHDDDAGTKIQHSCIATHQLVTTEDGNMTQLKLQQIVFDGESQATDRIADDKDVNEVTTTVTVSRIDDPFDLESRTELLHNMGMKEGTPFQCKCPRCIFERDPLEEQIKEDGTKLMVSKVDLHRLLQLAKVQGRYGDAMVIAEALVRRDPIDFKILFQRARIAGWGGNFLLREYLLNQAATLATSRNLIENNADFDVVRTEIKESNAYHRKTSIDNDETEKGETASTGQWQTPFAVDDAEYESSDEVTPSVFVGESILDAQECKHLVSTIEERTQGQEWTTSRHYSIPTTDIPVYQIPELLPWFNTQLERTIFPAMMRQFDIPKTNRLRILDAFFVKYNGSAFNNRLPLHNDQSDFSLTIAMNPLEEYEGGGTYFNFVDETVKTDIGGIISFAGRLLHAGETVTKGTRYIIVAFIYQESMESSFDQDD